MENVKLFKDDKVCDCYSVVGCESGVVFAHGLFKAKADKIVTCWNEHNTLTAKTALFDEAIECLEAAHEELWQLGRFYAESHGEQYADTQLNQAIAAILAKTKEL